MKPKGYLNVFDGIKSMRIVTKNSVLNSLIKTRVTQSYLRCSYLRNVHQKI